MSGPAPTYPILARLRLDGPRKVVWRNQQRLKDLPTERAGIGIVLDVDGELYEVDNGTPISRAPRIRSASGVILVDLRRRRMSVDVTLPSRELHREFTATAVFHCQVRSAATMVSEEVDDFTAALGGWTTNVLRGRARSIAPNRPAELEKVGRSLLVRALGRSPLLRTTVMSIELGSFEVQLSDHHRKALVAEEERRITADAKIDQLRHDDRINAQADITNSNSDDRAWDRRRRSAAEYEDALARGPEAMMALMLADDPSRMSEVLGRQLQDREALYRLLVDVTHSPHIDGSVMEPYAKHLAELVGRQLKVGPGWAPPSELAEGESWEAGSFGDGLPDDDPGPRPDPGADPDSRAQHAKVVDEPEDPAGSSGSGEEDPFDLDAVLSGEERPARDAARAAPKRVDRRPDPSGAPPIDTTATPAAGDVS